MYKLKSHSESSQTSEATTMTGVVRNWGRRSNQKKKKKRGGGVGELGGRS